ncbi:hypothetical protein ACHAW5_010996 [Stephanodiscus triporus]|uniref:uroporphyrinogen-III C-methyltransferase n=1 Tax=Stephanodiscus triporus TaxID=2934178 RepID=A0ABD3NBD7_9STRA
MLPPTAARSALFAMRGTVPGDDDESRIMIEGTTSTSSSSSSSSSGDRRENDEESSSSPLRRAIERLASIVDPPPARDDSIDRSHRPEEDASASSSSSSSSLSYSSSPPPPTAIRPSSAVVHIVGTGLSPTLMDLPLSTLLVLSRADVVLYDSLGLSGEDIRRIVPERCDVVCVGKRGEDAKSWKQDDIDRLLLREASEPPAAAAVGGGCDRTTNDDDDDDDGPPRRKCVVRLKGGDPFLFGRTRTEIDALRSNGIPYTYTPGISSCVAGKWNENTPCAVIQNAGGAKDADESTTSPVQKVWRSSLGNIVRDIKAEDATRSSVSPAVFVVGATASLDLLSQYSQS